MSEFSGEGKLHGWQAEPVRATFHAGSRGFEVTAGDERLLLDWKWLTIARGGFQEQMWVVLAEHRGRTLQLYVTGSADFAGRLLELPLPPALAEHLRAASRPRRTGCLGSRLLILAGLAFLGAAAWYGPGVLAGWLAAGVPETWERSLGRSAASDLLGQHGGACGSPALLRPVEEITARLVEAAGRKPEEFRVFVLGSEQVNAFALPGGYLFVCRGLIAEAGSAGELAGVLAHEVQHVLLRHGMRNVIYKAGLGMMLRLLLGGDGGTGDLLLEGAAGLGGLAFSRGQEREADEHGLELLGKAGFELEALGSFFRRLAEHDAAVPALLSTHPSSEDRAGRLARRIAELPPPQLRPLQSPWPPKDAACEPRPVPDPDSFPD